MNIQKALSPWFYIYFIIFYNVGCCRRNGEKLIKINGNSYIADGYGYSKKAVYRFTGHYSHGYKCGVESTNKVLGGTKKLQLAS